MGRFFRNGLHHVREMAALFGTNKVSNGMSLLSITLVFCLVGILLVGGRITASWVTLMRGEAEIQLFGTPEAEAEGLAALAEKVRVLPGVESVKVLTAEAARIRMGELLGGEAGILSRLEENPFRPFVEVGIQLETLDTLLPALADVPGVEAVRDNREVLDLLRRLSSVLQGAGVVVGFAAVLFTLVLMSHIARVGVVHNREQIRTLRLLGAPEGHIAMPFLLLGLLLGGGGGGLAALGIRLALHRLPVTGGSPLPFLPFPDATQLGRGLFLLLTCLGMGLSLIGTLSGLVSARTRRHGHELP